MPIPYGRQLIEADDIDAVVEVLRGDWLTQGPAVRSFEEALAEACGATYAVSFSSGTAALHGAAFAAGLGSGDELVTSPITFAASANCAAYVGATPRFADIDPATWNLGAETLSAALTDRTRAVVAVDFAGLPAPIEELRGLIGDDIVLIEDAAQALGALASGEPVGSCRHSDMAVFSLHPVKSITGAEGGVVTTNDAGLAERLREFRNHGFIADRNRLEQDPGGWHREQHVLGFNYRLSDVHSALAHSQLAKLDRFIEARNRVAARYREALGPVAELEMPPEAPPGSRHAYHLFVIWHRDGPEARRRLYDGLHERGILAQVHHVPVYFHPWYRRTYGYEAGLCPEAERYYGACLSLPCYPSLSEDDQQTVIDAVRELA